MKSNDQLAELANSFNSMTASLEELIEEQKQKQRLENELAIAHEVQEQLFPRQTSELESLEVHGFCRPARTVSGDYYDFLTITSDRMLLAVGDIGGDQSPYHRQRHRRCGKNEHQRRIAKPDAVRRAAGEIGAGP